VFKPFSIEPDTVAAEKEYEGPRLNTDEAITEEWIINTMNYIKQK
jgi:hypothetical protein